MDKLVLIDGSSLLATSFFGNLPKEYLYAKTEEEKTAALSKVMQVNGQYTNAVFTMSRMLLNVINKQKPTHIAVAWDMTRDTFRRRLYPEYKGQREEIKPGLASQFPLMQRVLKAMNIPQFVFSEYEADDILGTLSKKLSPEIFTYIYTKDQDSLQLVDEMTHCWLITSKNEAMYQELGLNYKNEPAPDNAFEFTTELVKRFYGVLPPQIVDRKTLEGDKSDNIPGTKGVGEKASIPLINAYHSIENLYAQIENLTAEQEETIKTYMKTELGISRPPLKALLATSDTELVGKKAALLSKQLATIKTDIPELQNVSLSDLSLNINTQGMLDIFAELEFQSLISKGTSLLNSSPYSLTLEQQQCLAPLVQHLEEQIKKITKESLPEFAIASIPSAEVLESIFQSVNTLNSLLMNATLSIENKDNTLFRQLMTQKTFDLYYRNDLQKAWEKLEPYWHLPSFDAFTQILLPQIRVA